MTQVYFSFSSVKDKQVGKSLWKLRIQQEVFPLLLLYTLQHLSKSIMFTGQQETRRVKENKKRYISTSRGSNFLIQSIAGTSMVLLKKRLQYIFIALSKHWNATVIEKIVLFQWQINLHFESWRRYKK